MDMEKARDLNGRMVTLEMVSMGLGDYRDPPSLEGIELVDLLEASRDKSMTGAEEVDSGRPWC